VQGLRNTATMNGLKTTLGIIGMCFGLHAYASQDAQRLLMSKKEYVLQWKATAIQQMALYKIPASITLAQGILESGSGNSQLARVGNNHFGIKCHGWEGKTMYMDDDEKGECFRVYDSAEDSYKDHSEFLTVNKRYNALFDLKTDDYKSWAKGLKDAGYATSKTYAEALIGIIEELNLNEFDQNVLRENGLIVENNSAAEITHSTIYSANKVKYIVAKKGDTYYRLSQEFDMALWQLYRYNDFGPNKDVLEEGDLVYLQPKKRKTKSKSITTESKLTPRELSQKYAVKLEPLMRRNEFSSPDQLLPVGEKVILR
jgi:LysM repeat protein